VAHPKFNFFPIFKRTAPDAAAASGIDANCKTDFLQIPGASNVSLYIFIKEMDLNFFCYKFNNNVHFVAVKSLKFFFFQFLMKNFATRFCGRFFKAVEKGKASKTVCSKYGSLLQIELLTLEISI